MFCFSDIVAYGGAFDDSTGFVFVLISHDGRLVCGRSFTFIYTMVVGRFPDISMVSM